MDSYQERQEELKTLFKNVVDYQFYDNGYLDLEAFCRILSMCFDADMALDGSPHPNAVYDLCLDLIKPHIQHNGDVLVLPIERYADANPLFHQDKVTLVHIGALIHIREWWIYFIGNQLMHIPRPEESVSYVYWVKPEWSFVMTFMDSFHMATTEVIKIVSRDSYAENGFCLLEALHVAKKCNKTYEEASQVLIARNESLDEALERIKNAVDQGFYLEAVSLEETVISACLYDYAKAKIDGFEETSLFKILRIYKEKLFPLRELDGSFFSSLDRWRKERNTAIHGFVEFRMKFPQNSSHDFDESSKSSAIEGYELTKRLLLWFKYETTDFLESSLPVSNLIN